MKATIVAHRGWIVPAMLAAVATLQLGAARLSGLSAWKGGGFGMFSTVDAPSSRFLRVSVITAAGPARVPVPRELSRLATDARTWPSKPRLVALGTAMARGRWTPFGVTPSLPPGPLRMQSGRELPLPAVPIEGVAVELWKTDFESPHCRLVARLVQRVDVPAEGGNHAVR